MKLKAHFGPSIPLVTFHSIKAHSEPNLTPTLCALLYQETGATYSPCHCLHRYIIKYSRTAPAENTSGARHFLLALSLLSLSYSCTQTHTHQTPVCIKILPFLSISSLSIQKNSKSNFRLMTNTHIIPSKLHLSPITNNNVLYYKLFCKTICLIQSSSPHCFNYNKSPSL